MRRFAPFMLALNNEFIQGDESVPRPFRNEQTVRDIFSRVMVAIHRGCGRPREVVVQHASEPLVGSEANIFQRLIETNDRPLVHLLMRPVATMNPHDRSLITVVIGVRRWPTESLRPVRGKTLATRGSDAEK